MTAPDAPSRRPPRPPRVSALVLGATGLVGRHCLTRLLEDPAYHRVAALTRRPLPVAHPKLETAEVDFDHLAECGEVFAVDHVFCCLGTTLRKAGSREAFRRVDLEYVGEAARLAADQGASTFVLVSALGADPKSRVFYNRVKGQAEEAVREAGLHRVIVLRPSLLLGDRSESRPGERLAQILTRPLGPFMVGPLARYRPIRAQRVAAALVDAAHALPDGVHVLESHEIRRLARRRRASGRGRGRRRGRISRPDGPPRTP